MIFWSIVYLKKLKPEGSFFRRNLTKPLSGMKSGQAKISKQKDSEYNA
jgi:hypothetical protein